MNEFTAEDITQTLLSKMLHRVVQFCINKKQTERQIANGRQNDRQTDLQTKRELTNELKCLAMKAFTPITLLKVVLHDER